MDDADTAAIPILVRKHKFSFAAVAAELTSMRGREYTAKEVRMAFAELSGKPARPSAAAASAPAAPAAALRTPARPTGIVRPDALRAEFRGAATAPGSAAAAAAAPAAPGFDFDDWMRDQQVAEAAAKSQRDAAFNRAAAALRGGGGRSGRVDSCR